MSEAVAKVIANRLNVLSPETERGWTGAAVEDGLRFERCSPSAPGGQIERLA